MKWTKIKAGVCRGRSLPVALMDDIGWFFSTLERNGFEERLAFQAELVADRASRIVPRTYDDCDFAWFFDKRGVFERVAALRPYDSFDRRGFLITDCIDLSLPRDLNPDQGPAYRELARQALAMMFRVGDSPSPREIEACFSDGANFTSRRTIGEVAGPGRRRFGANQSTPTFEDWAASPGVAVVGCARRRGST